jgi:hypothetical protein
MIFCMVFYITTMFPTSKHQQSTAGQKTRPHCAPIDLKSWDNEQIVKVFNLKGS